MKWVRENLCLWSVSSAAGNETWHMDDTCFGTHKMCNPEPSKVWFRVARSLESCHCSGTPKGEVWQSFQASNDPPLPTPRSSPLFWAIKDCWVRQGAGLVPMFPSRTRKFAGGISHIWPFWRREWSFLSIFLEEEEEQLSKKHHAAQRCFVLLQSYACRWHPLNGPFTQSAEFTSISVSQSRLLGSRVASCLRNQETCYHCVTGVTSCTRDYRLKQNASPSRLGRTAASWRNLLVLLNSTASHCPVTLPRRQPSARSWSCTKSTRIVSSIAATRDERLSCCATLYVLSQPVGWLEVFSPSNRNLS